MSTIENITLAELKDLLSHIKLAEMTRLTVTFDDDRSGIEILKKKRALDAMNKLRGSGNGNLLNALLKEREKDKLR
jgi:hypothetical protein